MEPTQRKHLLDVEGRKEQECSKKPKTQTTISIVTQIFLENSIPKQISVSCVTNEIALVNNKIRMTIFKRIYENARNIETGAQIQTQKCILECEGMSEKSLLQIPLRSNCTDIEIRLSGKSIKIINPFPTDRIKKKFIRYLNHGRPVPGFACIDFITYLFDKFRDLNNYHSEDWFVYPFEDKNLIPGATLITCKEVKKLENGQIQLLDPIHFSYYLGHKLYISVCGNNGPLLVTRLSEMKKAYGDYPLKILIPKNLE